LTKRKAIKISDKINTVLENIKKLDYDFLEGFWLYVGVKGFWLYVGVKGFKEIVYSCINSNSEKRLSTEQLQSCRLYKDLKYCQKQHIDHEKFISLYK